LIPLKKVTGKEWCDYFHITASTMQVALDRHKEVNSQDNIFNTADKEMIS
jgi:hypothetical protein